MTLCRSRTTDIGNTQAARERPLACRSQEAEKLSTLQLTLQPNYGLEAESTRDLSVFNSDHILGFMLRIRTNEHFFQESSDILFRKSVAEPGLKALLQYRKFRRAALRGRSLSALSGPETPFASQDFDVRGRNRNKLYNSKKERMQKSKKN